MFTVRRVTCAVDLSDASRTTMEYAADLARQLDAELTLVHVDERGGAHAEAAPESVLEQWRVAAEARVGAPVRARLLSGEPSAELDRELVQSDPDLVIVGMAHDTRLPRMVVTSVADAVTRSALCPVLVFRPERVVAKAAEIEEIAQYR